MFIPDYTIEDIEALVEIVKARYQSAGIEFSPKMEDAVYCQLCGFAERGGLEKANIAAHTLKLNPCSYKFS